MLPVQGNTVHQWRSVINSRGGDQFSNSISYATPTIMGTNILAQYALNNTVENGNDGTVFAANLFNRSVKNLTIAAAYNNVKGANSAQQLSAANNGTASSSNPYKNVLSTNLEGYAAGLKYKVTPAIEVGTFYAHGRTNNGKADTAATTSITQGAAGLGLGYQATPAILLGANYVKTTMEAAMYNLQAHYMLSKRTRVYSQITLTQAAKGNYQQGTLAANGFSPIACNSSSASCVTGLPGTAGNQNTPTDASAYNIGIIHTF
jgi:predicted porin